MASINYAAREISVKVVYYGPGLSGKTTNLQVIHKKVPQEFKSDMVSLATETDRTLFFDFLPLDLGKIKGFSTKFQLYTVPGQVYYNATRKLVLRGVDGVVFVADSAPDKVQENLESFQNLEENLAEYGYKRESIPIIIQYNKRDLPNALPIEELQRLVNKYNLQWTEAVANKGTGVFDSLKLIGKIVIDYLNKKYSRQSRPAATQVNPVQPAPTVNPVKKQQFSPAPQPFNSPQQNYSSNSGVFQQPGANRPVSKPQPQMPPQGHPQQRQAFAPPTPPVRQPLPTPGKQSQNINRPFSPPSSQPPIQQYNYAAQQKQALDDDDITFEPPNAQNQNNYPQQQPIDDTSNPSYLNYGNIPLQNMGSQQEEQGQDENEIQNQSDLQNAVDFDPVNQAFEVSDKTDLDIEIEKYQREIEEKQRRMRSQSQPPAQQQYQPPAQQQYQPPAQQQYQPPAQQQYQPPAQQQYQPPAQQQYQPPAQQQFQPPPAQQQYQPPAQQQYQPPAQQQYQPPAQRQYQPPAQQQYQPPAQQQQYQPQPAPYEEPAQQYQQQQFRQPPAKQQQPAQRQPMQRPPVQPSAQHSFGSPSVEHNDYDVYNMELPPYPAQNQQQAEDTASQPEDSDDDLFFTSVDTDRQKRPIRKPINPRTKQQKGFLSKFFNKDNP